MQAALRSRILQAYGNELSHTYKNKRNILFITAKKSGQKSLYLTLGAFALAIVAGILLQLLGNQLLVTGLDTYLFTPIKTMFLNALKLIMVPVVFFSLVTCISDLSNISELGRIGGKTLAFYLFTSMCAIAIGIGMFFLLQPGAPVMELPMAAAQETAQMESVSILNIIVNIVPDNIVTAFQNADMLQVIFIAVLCGIAVGAIGAPGVTGAAFICLSTLVVQLGIPVEAVTILMGIDQLMSMLRTTANSTGDAVGALVVAKSEKMLDVDMYRSR